MEEDIKVLNYRGLSHLVERLKTFFIKNPKNKAAGKYLRCIDSDGNVEWVSLPSFVNLIDGFDPTSLIIGGTSGRTLTTEAEVKGDCYIATAAGTLFPGTVSAMTLEAGDSIIFRNDVAAGTSITANDVIFIESSVSISPGTSLLSWDTEITLATVEGVAIKAKLPVNPNTDTQADWNESDTTSAAYINNKPTIPTVNNPAVVFSTLGNGSSDKFAQFTLNQDSDTEITIKEGANIKLYPNLSSNQLVIEAIDTTYRDFSGSSHGLVPASTSGDSTKFLKGDGTWATPSGTGLTGVSFNGTAATVTSGVAAITASVGDTNVIETVKVNGSTLTPDANKAVDIIVPQGTKTDSRADITATSSSNTVDISFESLFDGEECKYINISTLNDCSINLFVSRGSTVLGNYSRERICRIKNTSSVSGYSTITVSALTGVTPVTLTNMYSLDFTNGTGFSLENGKTLELVFTFWDVNDVTFNGGVSV